MEPTIEVSIDTGVAVKAECASYDIGIVKQASADFFIYKMTQQQASNLAGAYHSLLDESRGKFLPAYSQRAKKAAQNTLENLLERADEVGWVDNEQIIGFEPQLSMSTRSNALEQAVWLQLDVEGERTRRVASDERKRETTQSTLFLMDVQAYSRSMPFPCNYFCFDKTKLEWFGEGLPNRGSAEKKGMESAAEMLSHYQQTKSYEPVAENPSTDPNASLWKPNGNNGAGVVKGSTIFTAELVVETVNQISGNSAWTWSVAFATGATISAAKPIDKKKAETACKSAAVMCLTEQLKRCIDSKLG